MSRNNSVNSGLLWPKRLSALKGIISVLILSLPSFLHAQAPETLSPQGWSEGNTPVFNWTSVAGADSYDLRVTDVNGNVVLLEANIANTSFIPAATANLSFNTAYYWYVRSNNLETGTSSPWSVIKGFLPFDPAFVPAPQLPFSWTESLTPTFVWDGVAGAASYDFELLNADTWQVLFSKTGIEPATTSLEFPVASLKLDANKGYYWRVRAVDNLGRAGRFCDVKGFIPINVLAIPETLAPFSYTASLNPKFEWSAVSTATAYDVQIIEYFSQTVIFQGESLTNSMDFPQGVSLAWDGWYHWKVRAKNVAITTEWSDPRGFIPYDSELVPEAIEPFDYTPTMTPSFSWKAASRAQTFALRVIDYATGQVIFERGGFSGTGASFPEGLTLAMDSSYYWQIQGIDSEGRKSIWSPVRGFTPFDAGFVPQTVSPAGAVSADAFNGMLSWSKVEDAVFYRVTVDDRQSVVYQSGPVYGETFQIPVSLDKDKTYYWKVRAVKASGKHSFWSGAQEFAVYTAGFVPSGSAPNGTIYSRSPRFKWDAVPDATGYDFSMNDESGAVIFTSSDMTVNETSLPQDLTLSVDKRYTWKVRSKGGSERVSQWSSPVEFLVKDDFMARVPVTLAPVDTLNANPGVKFLWEPVPGATKYSVSLMSVGTNGALAALKTFTGLESAELTISAQDANLLFKNGKAYAWRVSASNAEGVSTQSTPSKQFKFVRVGSLKLSERFASLCHAAGEGSLQCKYHKIFVDLDQHELMSQDAGSKGFARLMRDQRHQILAKYRAERAEHIAKLKEERKKQAEERRRALAIARLSAQMEKLKSRMSKVEDRKQAAQAVKASAESAMAELTTNIAVLNQNLATENVKLKSLQAISSARRATAASRTATSNQSALVRKLTSDLNKLRSQLTSRTREAARAVERIKIEEGRIQVLSTQIQEVTAKLAVFR